MHWAARRTLVLASLLLAAGLAAAPPAHASSLAGTIEARASIHPTGGEVKGFGDILFISGALEAEGRSEGVHAFVNGTAILTGAHDIVVRPFQLQSVSDAFGSEFGAGTVEVAAGSTFVWLAPESNLTANAPFVFSAVVDLLSGMEFVQEAVEFAGGMDIDPTVMCLGEEVRAVTSTRENSTAYLFLLRGGARVVNDEGVRNITERHFFEVRGFTSLEAHAQGALLPMGEGGAVGFRRSSADAFESGFDFDRVTDLAEQFSNIGSENGAAEGGAASQADGALDQLKDFGPLLNGALFGSPNGTVTVGGETVEEPLVTIVRFTDLTVSRNGTEYRLAADATLVYTGGAVRSDRSTIALGPITFPVLSLILFVVAAGAYVGARFYKLRPQDDALSAKLRLPALLTHLGLLVLSFVLFDQEVKYVTGISLLGGLHILGWSVPAAASAPALLAFPASGALAASPPLLASTASTGIAAALVIVPWLFSLFFFGLPVKIAAAAGLRMAGLDKRARGFARGLGDLAAWLIGSGFISAFLGVVINPLAKALAD